MYLTGARARVCVYSGHPSQCVSVPAPCIALQESHSVSHEMLHHISMWILLSHLSEEAGGTERTCSTVKRT